MLAVSKLAQLSVETGSFLLEVAANFRLEPWVGGARGAFSCGVHENAGVLDLVQERVGVGRVGHGGGAEQGRLLVRTRVEARIFAATGHQQLGGELLAEVQVPGAGGVLGVEVPERTVSLQIQVEGGRLRPHGCGAAVMASLKFTYK